MTRFINITLTLALALAVGVVYVWTAQNSDQLVTLRLDLGRLVGAWELASPTPSTTLMGASFGVGALFTGTLFLAWSISTRRAEEARREALSGSRY